MEISKIFFKIFVLMVLSFSSFSASAPADIVENFDLRYYHPQFQNLADLSFEIRISNLKENVLKSIPLSSLDDLYYSVYWITPGKYHIEVNGLPKGYVELRNELKALIKNRLDFVLPQKLAPKIRSYSLKTIENSKGGFQIEGVDKTHQRGINRIQIEFEKNGKLKKFVAKSPMGSNTSLLSMSPKVWSNNKWVVDEITVISTQGMQKTEMKNKMFYKNYDGFGFPEKVVVTTSQEIQLTGKKNKKEERIIESEILFSNYQVNQGIAKKKILESGAKE